jgi:hypothetical protein
MRLTQLQMDVLAAGVGGWVIQRRRNIPEVIYRSLVGRGLLKAQRNGSFVLTNAGRAAIEEMFAPNVPEDSS